MSAPLLHILRHSPAGGSQLSSCLRVVTSRQAVLLIEDAVYALLPGSSAFGSLRLLPADIRLYVLENDLLARGLALDDLPKRVQTIGYDRMVELCAESGKVVSW